MKTLHPVSKDGTVRPSPFNIEKYVKIDVYAEGGKGTVVSTGMHKFNQPELRMEVPEGIYFTTACRILNDVARHVVERDMEVMSGMRVQLQPWTTVELTRVTEEGGKEVIEIKNATLENVL